MQDHITLGNLDARRDWGHARDYMEGAWRMLQQDKADDYVLASGWMHSVREFVEAAFRLTGIDIVWNGNGMDEYGCCSKTNRTLVQIDPALFRPNEVNALQGDASKARDRLGWTPQTSFEALVEEMMEHDRRSLV